MLTPGLVQSRPFLAVLLALSLYACGGGGGGSGAAGEPAPPTAPPQEPAPPVQPLGEAEAVRFLSQATFGPSPASVAEVVDVGLENWFLAELDKPASLHLATVLEGFPDDGQFLDDNGMPLPGLIFLPSNSFWRTAIEADDQLRQRMAFALSQILVVSADSNVGRAPQTLAHYADILTAGAFGNYRDLLEAVTYSPAMAVYLTYLRNEKADPQTGRVPDENYARELLQLFTVGLVALNPDGTPLTDAQGQEAELYDNQDITELAKVFTGLSFAGTAFNAPLRFIPFESFHSPLDTFEAFHSSAAKNFLGTSIPAGTGAADSIDMALDAIFNHPNVGPFIGRQLIQRFVTSAPQPAYVERVAAAFDSGSYALPSGATVGSGQRGDLAATLAAVLFDARARDAAPRQEAGFGKLREPVLRFTHWARAFQVNSADAGNELALRNTSGAEALNQHPYLSPSVFNFYRPGYIAPGTHTGDAGLTAPELQITNATSLVGYPNFLTVYALGLSPKERQGLPAAFVADYSAEVALAADPQALVAHLDARLAHDTLRQATRDRIADLIARLDGSTEQGRDLRARVASVLVMTSPEYIVLR
ncbi:MAG: hypothetical protein CME59_20065 [Halioglobus sp.]|nr:hypothetical protein [Halioglobus sp.]